MALTKVTGAGAAGLTLSSTDLTVTSGDLIFGTSAKGVVLGATSNTSVNTLSDYEEGTWTPAFNSGNAPAGTVSALAGQYIKVGGLVSLHLQVTGSSLNASSYMLVTGLPFAATNDSDTGAYCIGTISSRVHGWTTVTSGTGAWYFSPSGSVSTTIIAASVTYRIA
jgi:hypothetical protein